MPGPTDPPAVPTAGRIVHYTLEAGPHRGALRAAIVARDPDRGLEIDLQVFSIGDPDGLRNDGKPVAEFGGHNVLCRRGVPYGASGAPGTWRWPERA